MNDKMYNTCKVYDMTTGNCLCYNNNEIGYCSGFFIPRWQVESVTGMRVFENCLYESCQAFVMVKENLKPHVLLIYHDDKGTRAELYESEYGVPRCSDYEKFNLDFNDAGMKLTMAWKVSIDSEKKVVFEEMTVNINEPCETEEYVPKACGYSK